MAIVLAVVAIEFARRRFSAGEDAATTFAISVGAALCWLLLAARSHREHATTARCVTAAYVLLALAELIRACSAHGSLHTVGVAAGVQLAAATLIAGAAAAALRDEYRSDGAHAADLSRALTDLQSRMAEDDQMQRRRLHDARSAVVGVMGACQLLGAPAAGIDPGVLRGLVLEELHRLQSVLDPQAVEPVATFDLAAALGPVVRIHQLDGAGVHADLPAVSVVGRARMTATVLDNLLRNARVHAPGATVLIRILRTSDDVVTVAVEDDGPGIPVAERAAVLRAGVRGSAAVGFGEGLGLYSSSAAVVGQGGTFEVGAGVDGGTRVTFSLPATRSVDTVPALVS